MIAPGGRAARRPGALPGPLHARGTSRISGGKPGPRHRLSHRSRAPQAWPTPDRHHRPTRRRGGSERTGNVSARARLRCHSDAEGAGNRPVSRSGADEALVVVTARATASVRHHGGRLTVPHGWWREDRYKHGGGERNPPPAVLLILAESSALVAPVGLEPTRPGARDFKSLVSANSTTGPRAALVAALPV